MGVHDVFCMLFCKFEVFYKYMERKREKRNEIEKEWKEGRSFHPFETYSQVREVDNKGRSRMRRCVG